MKVTPSNFWRPFVMSGFSCQQCHVIIDLCSPGHIRRCTDCKTKKGNK